MNRAVSSLTLQDIDEYLESRGADPEDRGRLDDVLKRCDSVQFSSASATQGEVGDTAKEAADLIKPLERRYLS